jgi:hypothetical protein
MTWAVPTSPQKGSSARLRREAQIELRTLARLGSPRNSAGPRPPDPSPRQSLALIHLLLSLPSQSCFFPDGALLPPSGPPPAAHRRRGGLPRRRSSASTWIWFRSTTPPFVCTRLDRPSNEIGSTKLRPPRTAACSRLWPPRTAACSRLRPPQTAARSRPSATRRRRSRCAASCAGTARAAAR